MSNIRDKTIQLYTPPFKYEAGFIWDSQNNMVADDIAEDAALRIRGWGRIQYMPNAEELQDDAGKLIAEILTEHWPKP